MPIDLRSIAFYGKIPTHGDFVRRNAGSASWTALDAWIRKALFWARNHVGADLPAAYGGAGTIAFFFDGDAHAAPLVGVMRPSRDRVGRAFPFLMGIEVDEAADRPEDVPVHYASLFEQTAVMARAAAAGTHELAELPGLVAGHDREDPTANRAAYELFLRKTRTAELWERIWNDADDPRKYLIFKNLVDILGPLGGQIPPGFSLALRFPLAARPAEHAFDVSFWLTVTRRLIDDPTARPSFFWSHDREGRPALLLTLRSPDAAALSYLLPADVDGETLCNLEDLGGQDPADAGRTLPARYRQPLEHPHLTLAEFLDRL